MSRIGAVVCQPPHDNRFIDRPERVLVASIYGDDPECRPDAQMEANTRLITAAPDLLELVMLANDGVRGSHTVAWQQKARAAIAKATGAA